MRNNKTNPGKNLPAQSELPSQTSFLFHSIMKNSKIAGIFVIDEHGIILEINPGVFHFFGYSEDDIIGKNFRCLFIEEDREKGKPEKELAKVIKTGSASDNNYVVHKNGANIWVHGESILGKDESGKIFIMKVIYDLSVQHELEKTLLKFNKDLHNFVYTASHDLKAPINNIDGLLNTLETSLDNKEDSMSVIKHMKESVQKFKEVLGDLAFIGKMEQGQEDISTIEFDKMAGDVIYTLQDSIEKSKAVVHCDFNDAPNIDFSRKNLRSIIHNLLSNAIKYRAPERKPEIFMSTENVDGGYILFKVKDNGLGIKESEHEKLFLMYRRIHDHVEGTGIGLTIVQRILENNGGKIEVKSKEGEGSTFYVYFKI